MVEPIAIIGSSCRFPGGASSPSKLWQLLKDPKDVLSDIPQNRLNLEAFYHEDGEHHGSTNVVAKAYLLEEDPRLFDGPMFSINPMEADAMDPQQRLLLESVYECIESAGYPLDQIQGSATSVYVGCMTNDYHDIQARDVEVVNRYHGTGSTRSILSNRISYFFDLRGPSVTLDTACSSSLVALHFAVQSLRNGESTSSIVGGVNLIFDSVAYISESKLHMLSPTSRSSMWDASGDGYARGEGVSAVMLKTLSQALADGDHIECIIRETGMNQDGRTTGLTMPSGEAQARLIRETYARAGLNLRLKSDRPQYFEAHGTGTLAGDPQEARGIYNAFFDGIADSLSSEASEVVARDEKLFCGSIKTVIGHLEGCAGLAGLLKASLAVQHGIIPPNMLFKRLNPEIEPYSHRLQVPTQAIPWPERTSPRRASVNSFGFGGTNVHAIIEQYIPSSTQSISSKQNDIFTGPLLLSAGTATSLSAAAKSFADMLEDREDDLALDDLAFTTQTRRTTFPHRIWFPGGSRAELIEALRGAASTVPSELGVRASAKLKWHTPGILGIFTGQGAQWATMGRDLINECNMFRKSIEACEDALRSLSDPPRWSLVEELLKEQPESSLHEAALSQPLCTAVQIALVDVLAATGVSFRGVVGHSSGEIAATYAAGLLSGQDAMRVAYYRGVHAQLAQGPSGQEGAMMAVGLGIDEAEKFVTSFKGAISVAASNSPTSTTLSGDKDAILIAKDLLEEEGTFSRLLKVDTAYHSNHMRRCSQSYLESLRSCNIQVRPPNDDCIWVSSVFGHAELLDDPEDLHVLAGQYWIDNMCQTVLFHDALECSLWRAGPFDLAVEVGAHPALQGPATQAITTALGANSCFPYVATLYRSRDDVKAFSATLGALWATLGNWVDFDGWRRAYLGPDASPKALVSKAMPAYHWSHEQVYWKESRLSSRYRLAGGPPHELLGRRAADDSNNDMRWRNIMKVNELPWIRGHVFQKAILFPTIGYVAMAIEAAAEIAGLDRIKLIEVRDLVIPRALVLEDNQNGVETIFSVRRQTTSNTTTIETEFTCHSSVNAGNLELNCHGDLSIELFSNCISDEDEAALLPTRCPPRSGTTSMDGEAYYQAILNTTGLDYQGLFRGMKHIRRTLGFSSAQASWSVEDVGDRYLLHPGLLDVALQAILAAFVNPTRIPIQGSFLPSALSRLVFDPHARTLSDDGKEVSFESDVFLTNNTARSFEGDIHVFGPSGQCFLQAEGFRMDNWAELKPSDDRPVFSRLEYRKDPFHTNANNLPELFPNDSELYLIEAINRASFYYLRTFFSTVTQSQIDDWSWDRQAFYKAVTRMIQLTTRGDHAVAQQSWLSDSSALMDEYKQTAAFSEQADMKAIHVAGEHLASVMAGEERPLEVYLREDVWAPLYSHGRYQIQLNRTIADLVSSFAHRYPRASYLEVGAGSGGTTLSVLSHIRDALDLYTFTDVSAGFFEKARERLAETQAASADRIAYKVLDVERDPVGQGFETEAYDVIIAANVLHATSELTKAVQNVRKLLKPGGYLFILEVTGEYLEGLLLMGPLEGWWLGNREGIASQPGLTLQGWDDLFRETGFTGVDKHQSDVPDSRTQAVSVIVTQATDPRVDILRDPLEFVDDLPITNQVLIIGGESLALSRTIKTIQQQVSRFSAQVQVVPSIEKLDPAVHALGPTSVLALCDLERPYFATPVTEDRLEKLQHLFSNATDVLWVTRGHLDDQDPSSAMMIGLCRTMVIELEQLNLQFLNTTNKFSRPSDSRIIVESFIRLRIGAFSDPSGLPILWSAEPELTLTDEGEVLIPRLKPDFERNDRLNSATRNIIKMVNPINRCTGKYSVVARGEKIHLEESSPWHSNPEYISKEEDTIRVRSCFTANLPHSKSIVLVSGFDQDNTPVVALTDGHASSICIPRTSIIYLATATPCDALQLLAYANEIVSRYVLAAIPSQMSLQATKILIHGASSDLTHVIRQQAVGNMEFIFSNSNIDLLPQVPNVIHLHPRSSAYIVRQSLPRSIAFVIVLAKDDAVANKLTSLFPSTTVNLHAAGALKSAMKLLAETEAMFGKKQTESRIEHAKSIPAHTLPSLPASSLKYPAVVDWSVDDEHHLQVMVNPIHGRGLFSPDKSYLMVSLVSTLGRSICRWMVENGARHIALASRSAKVDPLWLEEMAHLGANIRVYRIDVSDKQSVHSTVVTMRSEMPPIAGVANAALVLRDGLFLHMTAAEMNEVLAPKVDGSRNLHEEFCEPNLDFFILFSTLSCVIGNAGQSNYDAASLYQVMLAKHRRQKGLAASVMEVGAVADVGYVAERGQALFDKLARTMKLPLSESDVHQLFAEAVAASPVREGEIVDSTTAEIVSGMGYYTYAADAPSEAHPPWFKNLLASHYVREERGSVNVTASESGDQKSVAARIDATTSEESAALVLTQALANRVETMLQMSARTFRVDASLLDVGIDSLLAVELRTWFLKEIHVDVPVLKILSGESGEGICAFAASQYLAEKSMAATETIAKTSAAESAASSPDRESEDSSSNLSSNLTGSLTPTSSVEKEATSAASRSMGDVTAEEEKPSDEIPLPQAFTTTAPMTHAQTRMWIADHMSSDPTQNNNLLTYDVHGFIHIARLRRALATVVAHHPGLRTCFFQDGTNTPRQGVLQVGMDVLEHITKSSDSAKIERNVRDNLCRRVWNLQKGQAMKIILISNTSSEHTLLIGYHHIAMDGSAWRTFFRDLDIAYQGCPLSAPGKALVDVAADEVFKGDKVVDLYWQNQFSPASETLPLLPFASTKTRPLLDQVSNHNQLQEINGSLTNRINALSRSLGVTSMNFYLAAIQNLLSRLTETDDFCIGVTESGRDIETTETIGFFLNLLPLRFRTSGAISFRSLVQQVNNTYREARSQADMPFDTLLEALGVAHDPTHTPLFQVGFDVRHGQSSEIPLGNCQLTIRDSVDSVLSYDIAFCIIPMPAPGPSYVQVFTRSDLYSQQATLLLAQMYITLLESAVMPAALDTSSTSLQIYPRNAIQQSLDFGSPKGKSFVDWKMTITARVDQMCHKNPKNTAIKDVSGSLSYTDLSTAVMSLSPHLLPYRGLRIAVLCEPQREWLVAMLAVFRIGGTFVSLDATLPAARLATMVRACKADIILCHAATKDLTLRIILESELSIRILSFEDMDQSSNNEIHVENLEDPSRPALILFTSGSTGVPKAILLSTRGFMNYLGHQAEIHGVHPDDAILQQTNLGFDMAIAEVLLGLTNGATLIIAPQANRGDPTAITKLMVDEGVSLTFACPTEYLMWLRYSRDNLCRLSRWRLAHCGGDKVPEALRKEMKSLPCVPVFADVYGPTEISICATMEHDEERIADDPLAATAISVGRPVANVGIFIVDTHGHICPPGIPGEIYINGAGVALGYVDTDATAQSFLEDFRIHDAERNVHSQGRTYKTGDRGVWRSDGTLGFLGRMSDNNMVKIRGLRIDLGDVETSIVSGLSEMICDAVVILHEQGEDISLVAHIVLRSQEEKGGSCNDNERMTEAALENLIHQLPLPRHMKPSRVVIHGQLPVTANGKVDRRALHKNPLPPRETNARNGDGATRFTSLKQVELHLLWRRILERPDVPRSSDVDFWAMGGSSLQLVRLQAAIRADMLVSLSIREMFMHSTLGSMAELIANHTAKLPAAQFLDWIQETSLTDELRLILKSPQGTNHATACKEILLTGADSFLGGNILQALLRDPSVKLIHCVAVSSLAALPSGVDAARIILYQGSNLQQQNLGLDDETIDQICPRFARIVVAGSHGHCLHNYASLRQPNVASTKLLATWAYRHGIPLHFISSSRVTLLPKDSTAALPPISVKDHPPPHDGSEGLTASKWASEVFLERLSEEAGKVGTSLPITVHRPCALVGNEAPSDDSLNAILRYSVLMSAVPKMSSLKVSGYFDFAPVEQVAVSIADSITKQEQSEGLRFQHHSSGVKVLPSEFKGYMENVHEKDFEEVELEEWVERALELGIEPMIAIYLRAVRLDHVLPMES